MTPSGGSLFVVYYLGDAERRAINEARLKLGQRRYPRGHRHAIKCGWYWIRLADHQAGRGDKRVGPFTASGRAYEAAITYLEEGRD